MTSKLKSIPIFFFTSLALASDPSTISQVMTSTCQANPNTPCSGSVTVQATSADAFVDSEGTLFNPQSSYYDLDKLYTVLAGFRHIRSGGTSSLYTARIQDMATAGLKTQYVDSANVNFSPDPNVFWSAAGQRTSLYTYLISNFGPNVSSVVDAVEGPNELDVEFGNTFWTVADHDAGLSLCNSSLCDRWLGTYGVAYQRALYNSIKTNPATADIKIIGPSVGVSFTSPFAVASGGGGADLQGFADWGGCHPYATPGNGNGVPQTTYDGSSYYNAYTVAPAGEVDFAPRAWDQCNSTTTSGRGTVYGATPLAPSEQGFFTGTGDGALSEDIQAIYYPRIYAEMYRHGIPRSITYRFDDYCSDLSNAECNFGLMRYDHSLKPAYFAIRSLNNLLMEPAASFAPGTLTYSVSIGTNGSFNRTQYMHDLLLQKSNGDFYLLFWHEIADVKKQNDDGSKVIGPAIELHPLSLPVVFTFPSNIISAELYTYDSDYNLVPQSIEITNNSSVSLSATDKISVLKLSANPFTSPANMNPIVPSSTNVNIPSIFDNGSDAKQAITLANTGAAAIDMGSINLSGANASDFTVTSDCGTAVPIAGMCTISVAFIPSAKGNESATLAINYADAVSGISYTQKVSLSGRGLSGLPSGTVEILSRNSTKALDVLAQSTANGATVQQYAYLGLPNQQWKFVSVEAGFYRIVNVNSGKVLDVTAASSEDGARIQQWDNLGTDNQKWSVTQLPDGSFTITNKLSGKVLDVMDLSYADGAVIQQWDATGANNQKWSIMAAQQYFTILNKLSGKVLDVVDYSTVDGAHLQQWTSLGGANQEWQFIPTGIGSYQILNHNSGKVLGTVDETGLVPDGTLVQISDYLGGETQLWQLIPTTGGYFEIANSLNGKVLDVLGLSTSDGARIQVWSNLGGPNQQWTISGVP